MTEQLKPCPFCGGDAFADNGPAHIWYVQCQECLIDGVLKPTKAEAIEAWNRRAQPAQAVPVLTDAELAVLMPPPDIDGSKARSPNAVRLAMRAVETAVRAKMGAAP